MSAGSAVNVTVVAWPKRAPSSGEVRLTTEFGNNSSWEIIEAAWRDGMDQYRRTVAGLALL